MDGLPNELIKLCGLASMAECGDHFWASVPALGLWAAVWTPLAKRWNGWRLGTTAFLQDAQSERLGA